jgi:uncharacterized RDD family membrane protein YckC
MSPGPHPMRTVPPSQPAPHPRRRRWPVALAVVAMMLAAYAVGLGWFAQRLQADLDKTLHTAPVVEDSQHRG